MVVQGFTGSTKAMLRARRRFGWRIMMMFQTNTLLFTLASPGCKDIAAPSRPAFQTDSSEYTLRTTGLGYEANIGYVFTNPRQSAAHFANCDGGISVAMQKLVGGEWVTAWVPEVLLCASPDIVVPAGGQYHSIVRVIHCAKESCGPKFTVLQIPGQYRIVWLAVADSAARQVLPLDQRTSNTFRLSVP